MVFTIITKEKSTWLDLAKLGSKDVDGGDLF